MNRPGTSPLTDIVDYGITIFGADIDGLVRVLARSPGVDLRRVESLLWEQWEPWTHRPADTRLLRAALTSIGEGDLEGA